MLKKGSLGYTGHLRGSLFGIIPYFFHAAIWAAYAFVTEVQQLVMLLNLTLLESKRELKILLRINFKYSLLGIIQ